MFCTTHPFSPIHPPSVFVVLCCVVLCDAPLPPTPPQLPVPRLPSSLPLPLPLPLTASQFPIHAHPIQHQHLHTKSPDAGTAPYRAALTWRACWEQCSSVRRMAWHGMACQPRCHAMPASYRIVSYCAVPCRAVPCACVVGTALHCFVGLYIPTYMWKGRVG